MTFLFSFSKAHALCLVALNFMVSAVLTPVAQGQAGPTLPNAEAGGPTPTIDGPPAPTPPAVISRDEQGNVTVRAVRLSAPFRLDGVLDEPFYSDVSPVTGFVQSLPDEGEPASEETEVWISFDDDKVYVSARLHESVPEDQWVANELRRDTNQLRQNDTFGVLFDTYYDRRNAVMFYTNPLGALSDFAITNEGSPNPDWNAIWDVRTGRFDRGWTVEMEIPFKSLRYRPGSPQLWGIQLRRAIRRKNEWAHLTPVPREVAGTGSQGVFRVSLAGTLVGIEAPTSGVKLDIKPYGIAGFRTDRTATPGIEDDGWADAGVDLKYGITENLTADFTYNTDFAQVEVDEQQVNLTRFSLFFPEKREFFLEGRGIFDFAPMPSGTGGGGGGMGGLGGSVAPSLFFSRRIGLERGQPVPIHAGARVTGKVGRFDLGAVAVRTGDEAKVSAKATDFEVLRLRRDIFRRSSVGALYARRSQSVVSDGSNETYGIDSSFSFYENVNFGGYYAWTRTQQLNGRDRSFLVRASYDGDEWGLGVRHLLVGENFNPEVGFLRRGGIRQNEGVGRWSPRPASDLVRQFTVQLTGNYIEDLAADRIGTREWQGLLQTELENGDVMSARLTDSHENLTDPFPIHEDVTIPVGEYSFRDVEISYAFGLQRPYSGTLAIQRGSFYDGEITAVGFTRGRIEVLRQFSLEPSLSFNRVELPQGRFDTVLAVTRLNYSFSPRLFVSGLVQYNTSSDTFSSNIRARWEYAPGSEILVVYTDERDIDVPGRFSSLSNRGLVVKMTRLLSF